jgi:hypothetical protein
LSLLPRPHLSALGTSRNFPKNLKKGVRLGS